MAALNSNRSNPARGSVIINDKLVIAGGTIDGGETGLSTIELTAPNTKSTTLSMVLPIGIAISCVVTWNSNTFMVIGGGSEGPIIRDETYLFNVETNKRTNGPSLKTGRFSHACHEMVINEESFVVVTGGFEQAVPPKPTLSTEILSKSSVANEWEKSKVLREISKKHNFQFLF